MVTIRAAQVADCRGIAEVQVDSYRTAYASFFPPSYLAQFSYEAQEQDWRDLLAANRQDVLLTAVADGDQVVGYALARPEADLPGYDAEIVALHVRRPWQGHGVGKALLSAVLEELQRRGYAAVMLWTLQGNPVRHWYEALGGQIAGEQTYEVDAWPIMEVAYGWLQIEPLQARLQGKDAHDHA